jgi:hypothetical protein
MVKLDWTDAARADLKNIVGDRRIMNELIRNASITLHVVTVINTDEGVEEGVMWHRGFTHDQQRAIAEGRLSERAGPQAWDYFLIYEPRNFSRSQFSVLSVASNNQIGDRFFG